MDMFSLLQTALFRPAAPHDAGELASLFAASWHTTYRNIIPRASLDAMIAARSARWWHDTIKDRGNTLLVAETGGEICGYATYGPGRLTSREIGEIYELYLAPEYQRAGLGTDLFEACRARLDDLGHNGLLLWVLSDNAPAIRFYERLGGEPICSANTRFGVSRLRKTLFAWDLV